MWLLVKNWVLLGFQWNKFYIYWKRLKIKLNSAFQLKHFPNLRPFEINIRHWNWDFLKFQKFQFTIQITINVFIFWLHLTAISKKLGINWRTFCCFGIAKIIFWVSFFWSHLNLKTVQTWLKIFWCFTDNAQDCLTSRFPENVSEAKNFWWTS